MKGKFRWKKFRDVDLSDPFFDPLKEDYLEFSEWFDKKCHADAEALVYDDETGVGAFYI